MILEVALTVAVAPVPIPLPVPTLKPLDVLVSKAFSRIAWQRDLAPDHRSGLNDCLLTDYDLGWKVALPLEARGSKKLRS